MDLQRALVIFTILMSQTFNVYSKICDDINFCYMTFSTYPVEFKGCENITDSVSNGVQQSKSWCTLQCLHHSNCVAFRYAENRCTLCDGQKISGLTHLSDGTYNYLARFQAVYQQTEEGKIELPTEVVGRMVVLDFTVLEETYVAADFETHQGEIALAVHCRLNEAGMRYATAINSFINGVWGPQISIYDPFPLQLGKRSTMHILITLQSFFVWIDGEFIIEYSHLLPIANLNVITFKGGALFHEVSV